MRKILNYIMILLVTLVFSSVSFGKNYRNKNIPIKETKIITLKKNTKGHILYILKKGRYKIRMLPNTVDYVDPYIVGDSTEINPDIEEEINIYELDTNKEIEVFKQEYKVLRKQKVKIEIEKIE